MGSMVEVSVRIGMSGVYSVSGEEVLREEVLSGGREIGVGKGERG